jgi:cellulose synthase/poly-beta-1,6-N-acetylglucosamine synthase-like glycosyltransferase
MPKVSVVMSVYNGERFLRQAVESILDQTLTDFEFIVVDDGSTDGTAEILSSYAEADPRLRIITQENRGLIQSLNRAIGAAQGEYMARMDADDISMPERLTVQVRWLDSHPQVAMLGTRYDEIDEHGKVVRRGNRYVGSALVERALLQGNFSVFCHGSVMFRRTCFEHIGGYREQFKHAEDYDLWLRMAEHYELDNLAETLYQHRLRLDSVSFEHFLQQQRGAAFALECARRRRSGLPEPSFPLTDLPPSRREMGEYHLRVGTVFLQLGHITKARAELRKAIEQFPSNPYPWILWLGSLLGSSVMRRLIPLGQDLFLIFPVLRRPLTPSGT